MVKRLYGRADQLSKGRREKRKENAPETTKASAYNDSVVKSLTKYLANNTFKPLGNAFHVV